MQNMPADDVIQKVRVVNRNAFTIRDRWDGIPIELPPGKAVSLTPDVAAHILGFPGDIEDMHRHMARRWGWNQPQHIVVDDEGLMLWQRYCLAITVTIEKFELRRVGDPDAPIPADGDDVMVHEPSAPVPRRKTRKENSKERSERMKRIWAERRANGLRTLEARTSQAAAQPSEPAEA